MSRSRAVALLALGAGGLAACPVAAHITLEYQVANADSYYKANFKVSHGCGQSAVQQIVVTIPAGVQGAKPMPKAGWAIAIERAPLAQPYLDHGRRVTEDVVRLTWTAKTPADVLPPGFYDEFALQAKLGSAAGPLYWPVSQICEEGRMDWQQIPQGAQKLSDLPLPAALLDVLPAAGGHAH